MITTNISRIGGKFRLRKELLNLTPDHDFFLSMFLGSGIYEINKTRCKVEIFNDIDSELMNYFLVLRDHPKEFDKLKEGILGLFSQEIFNRIVSGELQPKNNIEKAYFFYYVNKLSFGGKNEDYRGVFTREQHPGNFKGANIKTERPYTNFDNGLLTPINPKVIERLRYVNLPTYPFDKIYRMFEKPLLKHNITTRAFFYADPPYPMDETMFDDMYNHSFTIENHKKLIDICQNTKFRFMVSMGGKCDLYLKELSHFNIKKVSVKYSMDAHSQDPSTEYIIMNYDIKKVPKMKQDINQKSIMELIPN